MNMDTVIQNDSTTEPAQYTLYEMRKISGKSGSAAARLCNTSYRSLRNWETGETIPNIVNVQDLLRIYGFEIHQLDLTPYYKKHNDRIKKQKQLDLETDNPHRERKQFELEQERA